MRTEEMWAQFAQARAMTNESYDAWAFGGAPDELARLVLQGEKPRLHPLMTSTG